MKTHKWAPGKQSSALAKKYYKAHRTLLWDVHDSVCWHDWFRSWPAQLQQYQSNLHIIILFFFSCSLHFVSMSFWSRKSTLIIPDAFTFLNEENSGMFCCNLPMHCIRVKRSSVYLCTCVYAIFFLSSIFTDGMDFEDAIFSVCLLFQISLIFLIVTRLSS